MILGLGSDLCDIRRIEKTLAQHGERFIARLFTDIERAKSESRAPIGPPSYAKRFAAKEACAKALGTGLNHGVYWRDMGVVNLPGGKPTMALTGGALARLKAITPPGHRGPDRSFHHRRFPHGPGHRHNFGGPRMTGTINKYILDSSCPCPTRTQPHVRHQIPQQTRRPGQILDRTGQDRHLCRPDRGGDPHLPVPALQYSVRLDGGDVAGGRLSVRGEILLWL